MAGMKRPSVIEAPYVQFFFFLIKTYFGGGAGGGRTSEPQDESVFRAYMAASKKTSLCTCQSFLSRAQHWMLLLPALSAHVTRSQRAQTCRAPCHGYIALLGPPCFNGYIYIYIYLV